METIAEAALERLRERRDPGLAIKAALQALSDREQPGWLEGFVALFDAEQSQVVACNAGCASALIRATPTKSLGPTEW